MKAAATLLRWQLIADARLDLAGLVHGRAGHHALVVAVDRKVHAIEKLISVKPERTS